MFIQPPWPSLSSKRQIQTAVNQGKEGMGEQGETNDLARLCSTVLFPHQQAHTTKSWSCFAATWNPPAGRSEQLVTVCCPQACRPQRSWTWGWWCWLPLTLPPAHQKNVHELIMTSLNHRYKSSPYLPQVGTLVWGLSSLCPPVSGKARNLSISTSPRTLAPRFSLTSVNRENDLLASLLKQHPHLSLCLPTPCWVCGPLATQDSHPDLGCPDPTEAAPSLPSANQPEWGFSLEHLITGSSRTECHFWLILGHAPGPGLWGWGSTTVWLTVLGIANQSPGRQEVWTDVSHEAARQLSTRPMPMQQCLLPGCLHGSSPTPGKPPCWECRRADPLTKAEQQGSGRCSASSPLPWEESFRYDVMQAWYRQLPQVA